MACVKNNDLAISHLSAEQKHHFQEQVVEEDNIKSFYNVISSGDTALVDLLVGYKGLEELPRVLENLLAESYARLKIQNVPLPRDMEVFVESKLIDLRFYTDKDEENKKCTKVSLEHVQTRIKLTCAHAARMIQKYSRETENGIDGEFILLGRFIARNIRVLKRQLKGTYTQLPWEEIEFLLVCFTSAISEPREADVIYTLVLDQARLLKHLNHFVIKLREVGKALSEKDVNIKIALGNRSLVVRNILKDSPDFEGLYSDHDLVKSVYSLKRIRSYIRQALELDSNEGMDTVETLVLERTLQVVGESLKNTPDSPNVSEEVHNLLTRQAPRRARELSTALRDCLSHSRSYTRRPEQDTLFRQRLLEDLCKMDVEITYILYKKKKDALQIFLNKVINCRDAEELAVLIRKPDELHFEDMNSSSDFTPEFFLIARDLFETLKATVIDKTGVTDIFDEAEECLNSEENKTNNVQRSYAERVSDITDLVKSISAGCDIMDIKKISKLCLSNMRPEKIPEKFKRFLKKIVKICLHSIERHDQESREANYALRIQYNILESISYRVFATVEFMAGRIDGVDEFRNRIEGDPEDEGEDHRKVKEIFDDVVKSLDKQQDRLDLRRKFEKCHDLHRAKGELIKHFDSKLRGESSIFNGFTGCVQKLRLKHKNKQDLEKSYEEGDYVKCKSRIQIIEDHYGRFARIVEELSLFSREKYAEAFRSFFGTLRLKGKANQNLITIVNRCIEKRNEEISSYFSSRLPILDGLLSRAIVEPRGPHYVAVEMLVLELTEILDNISLLGDGAQFLDDFFPVLIGKNLRNYLAHGDPLVDGLPSDPRTAVTRAAWLILRAGGELVDRSDALIGGNVVADFSQLQRMCEMCLGVVVCQYTMFTAIEGENQSRVKHCVSNGADVRGANFEGWTGLHYAAAVGSTQILQFFLERNVKIDIKDIFGKTSVQIAYERGRINVIQYLIERNYLAAGRVTADRHTLLHLAAKLGRADIVSGLLNDESVNSENVHSQTPLHLACEGGHAAAVRLLLGAGAAVQPRTARGESPLFLATRGGHKDIVRLLLERGAAVYTMDDGITGQKYGTLLHTAAQNGQREVVKALLNYVDDSVLMDFIHAPNGNGSLALHLAAERGHAGVVEELLACGCSFDEEDENGQTALHVAAANGFATVIKLLLDKGASINATENHLRTSLHLVVQSGYAAVAQDLLDRGSDERAVTERGYTALHIAAANGSTEILQILLDRGAQIEAVTLDELTPLHLAVKCSQTEAVKCLINHAKKGNQCCNFLNSTDANNSTALHMAAAAGDEECAKELLKAGAMIEARDITSCTALHVAAKYGEVAIIRLLIENGCDINATTPGNNWSALHLAARHDHTEAVAVLIEKGIKLDILTENNETALLLAVASANEDMVQSILRAVKKDVIEAFVNTPQRDSQQTALHFSVKNGHKEITSLLLDAGADVEASDKDGYTAMMFATVNGHMDIFLTLLERNANINAVSKYGSAPLLFASSGGHLLIVKKLLELVSDPLQTDADARGTALHWAARNGRKQVAEFLLKSGFDTDAKDKDDFTPLHLAANNGYDDVAELLVRCEASVNERSTENWTPLHCASHNGHLKVVKLLLENGANVASITSTNSSSLHFAVTDKSIVKVLLEAGAAVNALDQLRSTALHWAARGGQSGVVSLLLDFGADPELKDTKGQTPLILATRSGHGSAVEELLSRGVNVNAVCLMNITALHVAAHKGNSEMVQILLNNGANAGCATNKLLTPLHVSAIGRFHDAVGILVSRGADVDAVDANGRTALHYAAASGHLKLAEELVKYGALDRKTEDGQTALKLAADSGHADVFDFLSRCWAPPNRGEF